jgi:uncharacterized pyridoxal phosphate-dependent enzyme
VNGTARHRALGIRPVINAAATLTRLGGSLPAPPVIEAMADAAGYFVDITELQARVGARIAMLTGNEAAYVSSGASAGITLSVAACVAGTDPALVDVFPDLRTLARNEVVLFHTQRNGYDYAVRQTGARIVEVADAESLRHALGSRTACVLWFAGEHYAAGCPPLDQIIGIARNARVPVLVDAAAQIPPIASLWRFTRNEGADAVIFSGGKGLRGPQSSGLVLGRKHIIEGCRTHGAPNHAIGRGMKVGKEEMLGLLAAVEWSLDQEETELLARYEATVTRWLDGLGDLPGVHAERGFPSEAGQPHSRAIIRVTPTSGWTRDALINALWAHTPRIAVGTVAEDAIALNPQTLRPGEDITVLDTIRQYLTKQTTTR